MNYELAKKYGILDTCNIEMEGIKQYISGFVIIMGRRLSVRTRTVKEKAKGSSGLLNMVRSMNTKEKTFGNFVSRVTVFMMELMSVCQNSFGKVANQNVWIVKRNSRLTELKGVEHVITKLIRLGWAKNAHD